MTCPSCPTGEKRTPSIPPGPGACCPTILNCEPIACTIDGVDYVAGEAILNTNLPCMQKYMHIRIHVCVCMYICVPILYAKYRHTLCVYMCVCR